MKIHHLGGGVSTIPDFLTSAECAAFVSHGEGLGYSAAAIQTDQGARVEQDVRNNDRVILDDAAFADTLFDRARSLLPPSLDGWQLQGFNPRLRYYRYDVSQQFDWHLDGTVRLSGVEKSLLTFMLYLNDDFEGGSTDFGWESVRPTRGMALVFPHRLRHRGAPVTQGLKYVLRTDVIYRLPESLRRAISSRDAP